MHSLHMQLRHHHYILQAAAANSSNRAIHKIGVWLQGMSYFFVRNPSFYSPPPSSHLERQVRRRTTRNGHAAQGGRGRTTQY